MGDDVLCFMDKNERENHKKVQNHEDVCVEEPEPPSDDTAECVDDDSVPIPELAKVVIKAKN